MTRRGESPQCLDCGQPRSYIRLPHGQLCPRCKNRRHYHPESCPGCGTTRPLAYLDHSGREVCAGCAGVESSIFACQRCRREDNPYGSLCARCVLHDRLTTLLTDPTTGTIHTRLQPVFADLLAGHRPQSVITYLTKPPTTGAELLKAMASGQMPITHDAFRELPSDRAHNYLRQLLAALSVLPPYQPAIERILPWLDTKLAPLEIDDANLIRRFTHWHLLRRLHHNAATTGTVTRGAITSARGQINAAIRLCQWARTHHTTITELNQTGLECYLDQHPGGRTTQRGFITWLRRMHLNATIHLEPRPFGLPEVTVSETQRWAHINTLLHDHTIRPHIRIAGLFLLLFTQPLSDICAMRTDQVTLHADGHIDVRFGSTPIQMPPVPADLIRTHLTHPGIPSITTQNHGWLIPGRNPATHLVTEHFRAELVALGIHPGDHRHAARYGLAAELPAPVLADLTGIADQTATRWATLAGRAFNAYIHARDTHEPVGHHDTNQA